MTGVVVFPVLLLFVAALTQLAAVGVLGRNRVAGIRIGSTLRSPAAWVAGHRTAAPWAWAGFAVSAAAGAGSLMTAGATAAVLGVVVVVVFGATIVLTIISARRGARAESPLTR